MGAIYYALGCEQGVPIAALGEFRVWGDARDAGMDFLERNPGTYRRLQILKVTTACHGYAERKQDNAKR